MPITPTDARRRFKTFCNTHPTQIEAANALGISAQYLRDLLARRRPLTTPILKKLGIKRVTVLEER